MSRIKNPFQENLNIAPNRKRTTIPSDRDIVDSLESAKNGSKERRLFFDGAPLQHLYSNLWL